MIVGTSNKFNDDGKRIFITYFKKKNSDNLFKNLNIKLKKMIKEHEINIISIKEGLDGDDFAKGKVTFRVKFVYL